MAHTGYNYIASYDLCYMKGLGSPFSGSASYSYQHHPKIIDWDKLISDVQAIAKDLRKIEVAEGYEGDIADAISNLESLSADQTSEFVSMMAFIEEDWTENHRCVCRALQSLQKAKQDPGIFLQYVEDAEEELTSVLPRSTSFHSLRQSGHLSAPLIEIITSLDVEHIPLYYDLSSGQNRSYAYRGQVGDVVIHFSGDALVFTLGDGSQFDFRKATARYEGNDITKHSLRMEKRKESFLDWTKPTHDELSLLNLLEGKNYLDINILQIAVAQAKLSN